MTREEAITVLKAFMKNPLFSEVHKAAFNIAIHDIKAYQDWNINNLILVNKDNYEPLEQEPTTKNDLGVDAVNREAVLDLIADYDLSMGQVVKGIHALPSVTPQEPFINKPCVSSGVCEHDKNKVLDKIREQIKSNLRGVEIALEVLAENHPLRQKMEGAKDTLEDCLELIDKADKEQE